MHIKKKRKKLPLAPSIPNYVHSTKKPSSRSFSRGSDKKLGTSDKELLNYPYLHLKFPFQKSKPKESDFCANKSETTVITDCGLTHAIS